MRICIATGTRAEYGLLRPLMSLISKDNQLTLQTLVTGSHLSPEFGLTYKQIETDGFKIDYKAEMLMSSDTDEGIVKSMGLAMISYAEAFKNLRPQLLVILGDRNEMLSMASAALIFKIPIVHLHGGEITEGAYDDSIRHAITKMAQYHFASTEAYRERIIQLGEHPDRVFNVGAIGLDNIKTVNLLSKEELAKELNIQFKKYNYQVTFHPATLDNESAEDQFKTLLSAIDKQEDSFFIFTKANADSDGRVINQLIDEYVLANPDKSAAFTSLGTKRFLSVVKVSDAIVGNSSSGIIEAPSLHTPTINIGDRQKGRMQADTVINVAVDENAILNAFDEIKTVEFIERVQRAKNPYGEGNTANTIYQVIKNIQPTFIKKFYDINGIN